VPYPSPQKKKKTNFAHFGKETVSRDILLQVFFMIHLPQAPENNIRVISNFLSCE
jgi:hypothetical protein